MSLTDSITFGWKETVPNTFTAERSGIEAQVTILHSLGFAGIVITDVSANHELFTVDVRCPKQDMLVLNAFEQAEEILNGLTYLLALREGSHNEVEESDNYEDFGEEELPQTTRKGAGA